MLDAFIANISVKVNTILLRVTGLEDRVKALEELEASKSRTNESCKPPKPKVDPSPGNWATNRVSSVRTDYERGYVQWNASEDKHLVESYESGVPIELLAEEHGRSLNAMCCRLIKLGYDESEVKKCLYTR
ncbi:hypothetical protein PQC39_gp003 [Vibrio phage Vp_R1]|uniref:Uncharacterized protein n=1 Tax=Vibrio phage Vp_R1 TaxID=2059867 RepID=A0A2H5BPW0_9CAUD|nr:hypothetical protein PQC39_gp003 [Vibrio phage Vp_R1]AUG88367.1 hypothetical protein VPR_003 [Vibrio phage Vp_R1]